VSPKALSFAEELEVKCSDPLPSIFPWSKKKSERGILSPTESTTNLGGEERRVDVSTFEIDQRPLFDITVEILKQIEA